MATRAGAPMSAMATELDVICALLFSFDDIVDSRSRWPVANGPMLLATVEEGEDWLLLLLLKRRVWTQSHCRRESSRVDKDLLLASITGREFNNRLSLRTTHFECIQLAMVECTHTHTLKSYYTSTGDRLLGNWLIDTATRSTSGCVRNLQKGLCTIHCSDVTVYIYIYIYIYIEKSRWSFKLELITLNGVQQSGVNAECL